MPTFNEPTHAATHAASNAPLHGDASNAPLHGEASNAPLNGVRVLDLGQFIAGPGVSMVLAELGADVIKVEPPGGESARHIGPFGTAMVRAYNRGKRSVAVDLREPRGREMVLRLAGRCDVVVQNLRPGAMQKLGLGADDMRARYPGLIYLSISGFGALGPSRDRLGFDIAAQAESGLMSVTGEPDGLPQKVGAPIIDSMAAHLGAQAVLAALLRRQRSGQGATLETSLLEAALHLQLPNFTEYFATGREPGRVGNAQPTIAPAADIVRTRDGMVVISAYLDEHWTRLCRAIDRPGLAEDPRFCSNAQRVKNRPAMREALDQAVAHLSSDECVTLLGEAQIVVGAVRGYAQVAQSADLQASGMVVQAGDGNVDADASASASAGADAAAYRTFGLPYTLDGLTRRPLAAAPAAGADTDAVLAQAGYTDAERRALREAGITA